MARPAALAALPDPPDDSHRIRSASPPPTTPHELQAAVEGVPAGGRVTFMGGEYRIADKVGAMPLFRFGYYAKRGLDADDMEGLAAVYEMLRDCFTISPACRACEACTATPPRPDDCPHLNLGDWPRFERDAVEKKAGSEELIGVVGDVIELLSARPTRRPSDSSGGPSTTSENSTGSSPSPDNQDGPDLVSVNDLARKAGA